MKVNTEQHVLNKPGYFVTLLTPKKKKKVGSVFQWRVSKFKSLTV